jgi:hypothetical protein
MASIMSRNIHRLAFTGFLLTSALVGAHELIDHPEDQVVFKGQTATFSVEPKTGGLVYQWYRYAPGGETKPVAGETNRTLTLKNVGMDDVGLYFCRIHNGDQSFYSGAASLMLCTRNESGDSSATLSTSSSSSSEALVIYATPVVSSGTKGSCPGSYAGYVIYSKTVSQGWGWAPSTNTTVHTASDTTRTDTKVEYTGRSGDTGCNQTSVTVPHPPVSSKYCFTIYFPNDVPTNSYPITLTGFDP